jgi:hypothetical protein
VIGQIILCMSGRNIALRGDSITAPTWAITERPRGSIVSNASTLWTLLCVASDIDVKEVTHIAGKDNSNCDRLSRREQDEQMAVEFVMAMVDSAFLESTMIHTARMSCQIKPHELRAKNNSGAASTVKLPVCESILIMMRKRLRDRLEWVGMDMQRRMRYLAAEDEILYLGCRWGFEMGARVSEYTKPEPGGSGHCARMDDATFTIESGGQVANVSGSGLGLHLSAEGMGQITECRVRAVSSKGKLNVKDKLVGRRSTEESIFLDDIIMFIAHSGARSDEELLSCYRPDGKRMALSSRAVQDELKTTVREEGLPESCFSSHSLRKGAITHMIQQ